MPSAPPRSPRPLTAVYYRVSTALQTTECQRPDVEAALKARGLRADVVYNEQASAVKRRPEFERMMADAAAGKFSCLVIWALDRFGRSMAENIRQFMLLDKAGVRVVSVREPWLESTGPLRELLIGIFSWVAQQERALLIERTKNGIANSKRRGVAWGKPSVAHGVRDRLSGYRIIERWDREGRPGGYLGLGELLGGCSNTTARKMHLRLGGFALPFPVGVGASAPVVPQNSAVASEAAPLELD